MNRQVKVFTDYKGKSIPTSNKITFDLGGLQLTEKHLADVRSEAVRAALFAAANLLRGGGLMDGFGTFSTFSTFSTFGSGSFGEGGDPGLTRMIETVASAPGRVIDAEI